MADPLDDALARRLPTATQAERAALARAYRDGVAAHALDRTTGLGPVPTTLSTERADLMAHVARVLGRLPDEDEVAALLRIPLAGARSLHRTMLAVYDDLPDLGLRTAFDGAKRDGRGSAKDVKNGYRVLFASVEKRDLATRELERRGYLWESLEESATRHLVVVDPTFPIADYDIPGKK